MIGEAQVSAHVENTSRQAPEGPSRISRQTGMLDDPHLDPFAFLESSEDDGPFQSQADDDACNRSVGMEIHITCPDITMTQELSHMIGEFQGADHVENTARQAPEGQNRYSRQTGIDHVSENVGLNGCENRKKCLMYVMSGLFVQSTCFTPYMGPGAYQYKALSISGSIFRRSM